MSDAYQIFREGQQRLRKGMAAQATVPLEKAKRLEPSKASIREALGIAYFRLARWEDAEREFRAIVEELVADRRLRPLRTRPRARAAGAHRRGERPLQARELDEAGLAARTRRGSAARRRRVRAVVQRVARASVEPGGAIGAGPVRAARHRRGRRREPRDPARREGRAAARSSRTTTGSSTGRCSTRAARRSSSGSSR